MRNKIQQIDSDNGNDDGTGGDFTPLPFLTMMVRAGILRDLAEGIIAYGLKPKFPKKKNLLDATEQFQTFANGVMNAEDLPEQKIIDMWSDFERSIGCMSKKSIRFENKGIRYDVINTQEMNIKHDRNQKEVPSLINLMMIGWQAMLCNVYFVDKDDNVDHDPRKLTRIQYIGNSQKTQPSRYNSIKFATSPWNTTFFNRDAPATDIKSFKQFMMFLCVENTRPGLTSKSQAIIKRQALHLVYNVTDQFQWTFRVTAPNTDADLFSCEDSEKKLSSAEKQKKTMKKIATMKDAMDFLIARKGFGTTLPEDFMPYWTRLSSVIDTLGADTTKKTKTKKPKKKRKKTSDKTIDAA